MRPRRVAPVVRAPRRQSDPARTRSRVFRGRSRRGGRGRTSAPCPELPRSMQAVRYPYTTSRRGDLRGSSATTPRPRRSGGFTIVGRRGLVHRLDPHPDLTPSCSCPDTTSAADGRSAGAAVPDPIRRWRRGLNIGHASLTVDRAHAATRACSCVALQDTTPRRRAASHRAGGRRRCSTSFRSANVPACLSGSGPSLLAFERDGHVGDLPDDWRAIRARRPGINTGGVEVVVED